MKSFLQGKKSLDIAPLRMPPGLSVPNATSRDALRTPVATAQGGGQGQGHGHAHANGVGGASVEVVKEGDKVVRLIVTCTCGERIEVECLYPAGM